MFTINTAKMACAALGWAAAPEDSQRRAARDVASRRLARLLAELGVDVLRRYFASALIARAVVERLFTAERYVAAIARLYRSVLAA